MKHRHNKSMRPTTWQNSYTMKNNDSKTYAYIKGQPMTCWEYNPYKWVRRVIICNVYKCSEVKLVDNGEALKKKKKKKKRKR